MLLKPFPNSTLPVDWPVLVVIFFRFTAFFLLILLQGSTCAAAQGADEKNVAETVESTVPDRDVQYAENSKMPQWKVDWDQARALYRSGKIGQALVQYELLLQKKSTVDEARWEYTGLLIQEKRWRQAGSELDTLLSREPDNRKYLLARAGVSLEEGLAEQAVKQYGQLYEGSPSGDDALEALTGLVAALDKMGNREAQLPLLEQLLLRKPGDLSLLKQIGKLALEIGHPEKTKDVLQKSLEDNPDDVELLRLIAQALSDLGERDKSAVYWQRIITLNADDIEACQWLASYYQQQGDPNTALFYVEHQLKKDPGNVDLILQAAALQEKTGHPGRALDYLSLYLDLVPDDKNVLVERTRIRRELATDLITFVQNKKAQQLWQDLSRITGDREGVYLQMAEWLRQHGKKEELTDVLLVLYRQHPDDRRLYQELVPLMQAQGRSYELEKL